MTQVSRPSFTSSDATLVLANTLRNLRISPTAAHLIRLGENAIFRLTEPSMVVRIARGTHVLFDVQKEVAVADWLSGQGILAAQPIQALPQAIVIDGHPVTFWEYVVGTGRSATLVELAEVLHRLHGLAVPSDLDLPSFDMFGRIDERVQRASTVASADLEFLRRRLVELRLKYTQLEFVFPPSALHGDAHTDNLIVSPDGPVLIDLERFAFGPREIDLALSATETDIGWHTADEYRAFADAYGFDIMAWPGFPVLREIYELKMATWLMQNVGHSKDTAEEFKRRLDRLRNSGSQARWTPF